MTDHTCCPKTEEIFFRKKGSERTGLLSCSNVLYTPALSYLRELDCCDTYKVPYQRPIIHGVRQLMLYSIYTNTSDVPLKVWQKDGTVEYGKGGHLILMIVTGVVVGSILITYLTVLLAGRPIMKINKAREYLRPIYEAIHAPYKHNKEFFFSFSIILVAFLYLLSYIFIGSNYSIVGLAIGIPVTGLYLTITAFSQPFKEMYINILNVVIFTITGIVNCWHYLVHIYKYTEESPNNNWGIATAEGISLFNLTSTPSCSSSYPLVTQYLKDVQSLLHPLKTPIEKKSKDDKGLVMYLQFDCGPPSDRDSYVKELMKHVKVDSYGQCLHNRDLPENLRDPAAGIDTMELLDIISQYKFALAIENAICTDYITEKFWRPLYAGTVPIVKGSPKVKEWAPSN